MKINKKQVIFVACASVIFLASILFSVSYPQENKNLEATASAGQVYYVLSGYEGRLAVFHDGNTAPVEVYDVFISSLPEADRNLLENGLRTNSKKQLLLWVEDYLS